MNYFKSLVSYLRQILASGRKPQRAREIGSGRGMSVSAPTLPSVPEAPSENELAALSEYVEAARAAASLLERIRQLLKHNPELEPTDAEAVLARFERAERGLSGIGYAPILPRAFTRIPRDVHDVTSMVASGMIRRRPAGKLPIFYANGLRRNVETLLKQGRRLAQKTAGARPPTN